jgi:hypothetical protein
MDNLRNLYYQPDKTAYIGLVPEFELRLLLRLSMVAFPRLSEISRVFHNPPVLSSTSAEPIMAVATGGIGYLCANIILQFLAVVGVVLRVVARRMKRQSLKADDWAIFVSLVR